MATIYDVKFRIVSENYNYDEYEIEDMIKKRILDFSHETKVDVTYQNELRIYNINVEKKA